MKILLVYAVAVNLALFICMAVDKSRAQHHAWRIRESTLFLLCILGGSVGGVLGMWLFHHKTRHWYFVLGFPLCLLAHIGLIWFFLLR